MPWFILIPIIALPFTGFLLPADTETVTRVQSVNCIEIHSGVHPPTCKNKNLPEQVSHNNG